MGSASVFLIGGHGRTALLAEELLVGAGADVTATVRSAAHANEVAATGARAYTCDVRAMTTDDWVEKLAGYSAVIWCAGAGTGSSREDTFAVDRDAALRVVAALKRLAEKGTRPAPRFLMVSFAGSVTWDVPEDHFLHHYSLAKRAVDTEILAQDKVNSVILCPTALSFEPVKGIAVRADNRRPADMGPTSRHLVAQLLTAFALAGTLPAGAHMLTFCDGENPVPADPAALFSE